LVHSFRVFIDPAQNGFKIHPKKHRGVTVKTAAAGWSFIPHRIILRDTSMSSYVKLTSAEGHDFFVHRDCADVSQTIGAMLSGKNNFVVN
jgi:hypothetical protein